MIATLLLAATLAATTPATPRKKAAPRKAAPTAVQDGGIALTPETIQVDADASELRERQGRIIYTGNVKARRGNTRLTCDRLVAYLDRSGNVSRVECAGNVQVTDQDRWARADRADFDNVSGVVEMTGNPEIRQGERTHTRGTKITFYVGTETLSVENPRSVFDPKAVPRP